MKISHEIPPVASSPSRVRRVGWWLLLAGVIGLVILVDQISKIYVADQLRWGESWMPVDAIEPFFRITLVHNTGAAFGLFPSGGGVFLIIAVIVSGFIIYYYRQLTENVLLLRLALGLQMGGALGNVIDRIRLGYVVDFFNVEFWPVFNMADSCIVVGVALLMFEIWRTERREARQIQGNTDFARQADDCADSPGSEAACG